MSISLLEKNGIIAPFLSSPLRYIAGQDPMGLLNTGENAIGALLAGLNSATPRIRYYSFYCWLLDRYGQEVRISSKNEQYRAIRRAEYLSALLAAKREVQGIAGITRAQAEYASDLSSFSLVEGTHEGQASKEGSYWKNPRGIFGTNYVSSLVQMGLIKERESGTEVYIRTDFDRPGLVSGRQLSRAFEESLGKTTANQVWNIIQNGVVHQSDLEELTDSMDLLQVPYPSREHDLLWQMIIGPDEPLSPQDRFLRKNSVEIILRFTQSGARWSNLDFALHAYHRQGRLNGTENPALNLWYFFQLEEFWQMIGTGGLSALLLALEDRSGGGWISEKAFLEELTNRVVDFLAEEGFLQGGAAFEDLPVLSEPEEDLIANMRSNRSSPEAIIGWGIILLRKLIARNEKEMPRLRATVIEYLGKNFPYRFRGSFLSQFPRLQTRAPIAIRDWVSHFLKEYILLRHYLVALRKQTPNQSTEKFVRDEGLIRLIDRIGFDYTFPRLGSFFSFLRDLQLLEADRHISTLGAEFLEKLKGA